MSKAWAARVHLAQRLLKCWVIAHVHVQRWKLRHRVQPRAHQAESGSPQSSTHPLRRLAWPDGLR